MAIETVFAGPAWERLAAALFHFLWQGAAIGAAAAIALAVLRPRSARVRYALALSAFAVLAACPPATFLWIGEDPAAARGTAAPAAEARPAETVSPDGTGADLSRSPAGGEAPGVLPSLPRRTAAPVGSLSAGLRAALRAAAPWALSAWIAGVAALSIRLLLAGAALRRLEARAVPVPHELARRASLLARALGLGPSPRVLTSQEARDALAAGLFRKVVLVPAGWLVLLPPEALEAVIAHELAHLRRLDPWMNLLQRVVEVLLFYHPAMWWLSRRIRIEREMVCDELAALALREPARYAEALGRVAALGAAGGETALAPGAGGPRMAVLARVRNVLGLAPERRGAPARLAAVLSLGAAAAFAACAAATAEREAPPVAKEVTENPAPAKAGEGVWANSIGMEFRRIGAGETVVEQVEDDGRSWADDPEDRPTVKRRFEVEKDFEIGLYEVSAREFREVMGQDPKNVAWSGSPETDVPAMDVSWDEAVEFCRRLSDLPAEKAAGRRYRLPSEAEWVRANETWGRKFTRFDWDRATDGKAIWELCSDELPGGKHRARVSYASGPRTWAVYWTFRVAVERGGAGTAKGAGETPAPRPSAVDLALDWLARHQSPDGRWSTDRFFAQCAEPEKCADPGKFHHDVGLTGLAVLAFVRAGRDLAEHGRPAWMPEALPFFDDAAPRGIVWLLHAQDAEGCLGPQEGEFMYDHAIAALAVAEVAARTKKPEHVEAARKATEFILKARNPGFAWRYGVRPGDNDTSVTGWCVRALKAAEGAGIAVDPEAYKGALEWLRRVTNARGKVGYESPGDEGSVLPGVNDAWKKHPTMTAIGLGITISIKRRGDPWMKVAANEIVKDLPAWDAEKKSIDFYYWHHAAAAVAAYAAYDPQGRTLKKVVREAVTRALLPHQEAAGCAEGSWDPKVDKWGSIGGRVYATALNALTLLEVSE
jgi:beta-lactamase regulating signal transducer with metallopeptidase domain